MAFDLQEQEQIDELKAFWRKWGTLITGVLVAAFAGLFTPGRFAGWGWFIGFMLVYNTMFLPKVDVVVVDKLGSQPPVAVGNVPIGVAFFGHYTNSTVLRAEAGRILIDSVNDIFDSAINGPTIVSPDAEQAIRAGADAPGLDRTPPAL